MPVNLCCYGFRFDPHPDLAILHIPPPVTKEKKCEQINANLRTKLQKQGQHLSQDIWVSIFIFTHDCYYVGQVGPLDSQELQLFYLQGGCSQTLECRRIIWNAGEKCRFLSLNTKTPIQQVEEGPQNLHFSQRF